MNFIETLKEFQSLGCADEAKCALASRVFLDLQKDSSVTDLQKVYDSSLNLLYLVGKRKDATVNFVPVLGCQNLSLYEVEEIQTKLANDENEAHKSITLAVCDTTSTILYYKMSSGFVEHKNGKQPHKSN